MKKKTGLRIKRNLAGDNVYEGVCEGNEGLPHSGAALKLWEPGCFRLSAITVVKSNQGVTSDNNDRVS